MSTHEPTSQKAQPGSQENAGDQAIIDLCDESVKPRRRIELAIVHELIRRLREAGYTLEADNGEDAIVAGQSEDEMIATLFAVDESYIHAFKAGAKNAWIYLVFGNDGPDVVCDYLMSLEPVMEPLGEWIDATFGV